MERTQLENIYIANGLTDFRLNTVEDILKCHGHDCLKLPGYETLSQDNKEIFKKFIVKIFNAWGLESRAALNPKGIYLVEDKEYNANDPDDEENENYIVTVKRIIKTIDKEGKKKILHQYKNKEYLKLPIVKVYESNYLRFEYSHWKSNEWLHVINDGEEWY